MRALLVDPGGTTGWAVMDYDFTEAMPTLVLSGQTPGDRFPKVLRKMIRDESMGIDIVIYERFRIFKNTVGENAVPVLKQIGAIEYVCGMYRMPWRDQPPSNKSFFEKKLKAFGMYQVSHEHSNDAISHGLFFFMTEAKSRDKIPSWVLIH